MAASQVASRPRTALGSADPDLVVDRVSPGIAQLIGESAADVVGRPLFELLDVDDPPCMIRELAARDAGPLIRGGVRLRGRHAVSAPGRLVVFPMDPVGSCVFTFEPAGDRAVADVMLSARRRPIAEAMHRLSHRERQIVLRLVGGDRVPLIARELFLSQSTVRNQLSAAYRKLGVSSQQELIHLFRCTGAPPVGVRT